jgi:hypothetical protein
MAYALFEIRPWYTGQKYANGSILFHSYPENYCILGYAPTFQIGLLPHQGTLHSITSQKMANFRFTAMRTTNLTYSNKVNFYQHPYIFQDETDNATLFLHRSKY